ncbi:MAG: transporter ATP-binding protein [Solirubrobacteraceae bacterium]|nr:transporter ATP-binding protein [Solirubrobacteraceae bacterium]
MLRAPWRTALLTCGVAALCAAPAAHADATPPKVVETPVSIAASQPDDEGQPVTLDGGVDVPDSGCPCPGVIINHGFLGSWHDSGDEARSLAAHGYVVLRYSSRGFGNTPGEVDLMGAKERQDLLDAVHWLNNPSSPVVGGLVVHNDIGQFGGSYGGAHAWSLAMSGDPAVRTVIPTATWTDIYGALMPNDVELLAYVNGFYATGLDPVVGAENGQLDTRDNYSQEMHRWIAEANSGLDTGDLESGLDSRSVKGRYADVHIPVFIIQGTNDGLFTQNQAVDAYQALHKQGTPVRLYVGGIGHPPSDGDLNSPEAKHVEVEVLAWFDHYLKHEKTGITKLPPIEYSHAKYFGNTWDGTTMSARRYPFGPATHMSLCTTGPQGGTLSATSCASAPPAVALNGDAGQGVDQEPVTAGYAQQYLHGGIQALTGGQDVDFSQMPPTLSYDGNALATPLDLVGITHFHLQVGAVDMLPAGLKGGAAAFQLDPKLYDVSPDGSARLITRGAFAQPLDAQPTGPSVAPTHPVSFDAFGSSYTIPAGHRLRITLSTADAPYLRPTPNPFAAVLLAGSAVDLPSGADMVPTPPLG